MFKVSEVAKKTGLSVRTLHHYEEIGLLPPSKKNEYGHRLYDEEKLFTLQQISVWKDLGFSLNQIQTLLHKSNPIDTISAQIKLLDDEKERIDKKKQHLMSLKHMIAIEDKLDWEILFQLIEGRSAAAKNRKKYVSMLSQLPKLEATDENSQEWLLIYQSFKAHYERGTDLHDSELQNLCKRTIRKSSSMFGGDLKMQEEYWEIRKSPEKSKSLNLYPVEPGLMSYMEKAINAVQDEN
ncbi:MerR family transcriptional regulator [Alteribacter aurantiacus]|uniref:MerR family transcriptional regulator n=1 Tax=Alteribacter aurantiacus TaxID=254410 RepID=UPI0003F6D39F|nr:MerR family transcriptional regulator [Alteribacter aurantiacus]